MTSWMIDLSGFVSIYVDRWALWPNCIFHFLVCHLLGLLWLLLQQGDAVSVLMNSPSSQIVCSESQDSYTNDSQNLIQSQEQRSPDHCPLPLLLKKVSVQTSCTSTQHPHSASDDNPGLMCLWMGIQRRFTLDKYLCYMSGKSMQRLHRARFFFFCAVQHTIADDVDAFFFLFITVPLGGKKLFFFKAHSLGYLLLITLLSLVLPQASHRQI